MTLADPKFILFDHNPSWKENQRQKREIFFRSASYKCTKITSGRHRQKGLNLLFFNFLTSAWSLTSW